MSHFPKAEYIDRQVLHMIRTLLGSAPVNWDEHYDAVGLGLLDEDSGKFVSQEKILGVFDRVASSLGDPYFVARYFDAEAFYFYPNLYGSVMALSENMREFERHYEQYNQLYKMGGFTLSHGEQGGCFAVELAVHSQHPGRVHFADFILLFYNASLIRLSGRPLKVIKFNSIRNQIDETLYWRHFGTCKCVTGMPNSELYCELEIYQRAFRKRDPQVLELIRKSADQKIMEQPDYLDLAQAVSNLMLDRIGSKSVSAEVIARALGMSRATLFRRLKSSGQTFQKIHDNLRFEHATRLLLETRLEPWKIAQILGFSTEDNFRRFFKSCQGVTPKQYRKGFVS